MPQLFAKFPGQRRARRFAGPDFSAGELPFQGQEFIGAPLTDQHAPVPLDDGRHDANHDFNQLLLRKCEENR